MSHLSEFDESQLFLENARNDLLSYCIAMIPNFVVSGFSEALCKELQHAMETSGSRLIITAPPRHGKSFITSELGQSFYMGRNPDKKVVSASHNQTLADYFGLKVRNHLSSEMHGLIFGHEGSLDKSRSAKGEFATNGGGEYFAVGVGGSATGKGANVFVIDDPFSGREQAEKETERTRVKQWFSDRVRTRIEGREDGSIVVMHTRWHQDDLAGHLLNDFPDEDWKVINFPAIIDEEYDKENDYLGRDYGEVLVPQLHSAEKLRQLSKTVTKQDWYSMYQQNPRLDSGSQFTETMLLKYKSDPREIMSNLNRYIVVDPANSRSRKSDFTAMVVVGVGSDGNFYILDIVRERMNLTDRTAALFDLHRQWGPKSVHYEQYGMQADIQHIEYVQEQENYRFPVHKISHVIKGAPSSSKGSRIERLIPDMTNGRWYAPQNILRSDVEGNEYDPIKALVEEEMKPYPAGKFDDILDAMSHVYDIDVQYPTRSQFSAPARSGVKISPW